MRFPREFRSYISNPQALALARFEKLKFSYWFRLHIFVAFVMTFAFTPTLVDIIRNFKDQVDAIPAGITATKTGDTLSVKGIQQPYTAVGKDLVVTLDTTGVVTTMPTTSTVFISAHALEFAGQGNVGAQQLLWRDSEDFTINFDDFKKSVESREKYAVTALAAAVFTFLFFASVVSSALLILVLSFLEFLAYRFLGKRSISFRDAVAVNLVAITGPLVLWGILTIGGFPVAGLLETVAFVVYSMLGLQGPRIVMPPPADEPDADK